MIIGNRKDIDDMKMELKSKFTLKDMGCVHCTQAKVLLWVVPESSDSYSPGTKPPCHHHQLEADVQHQ
ncbi:hypothetical protein F444_02437 [Phytophthora nicotianae P1976]|uniref:Uncharacterized protein n=1 Tax=Phytophthora nicotianae P1976 TaxID=1317066 RepID=A0A081AXE9_PHYNI|nr:hypothetical protein F444_02437 [Phytophthora nicotianae P1976]